MSVSIPLGLIGVSHKTAPIEVRDQIAFNESEQIGVIPEIISHFHLEGCFIISTCNRTEVYLSGNHLPEKVVRIKQYLDEKKQCNYFCNPDYVYEQYELDVVRHYFSVISGIDSQIVGEVQIAGQVKDSYELAHGIDATDSVLNKLFNFAMQAKKSIYNETFLSDGTVSVSFAGVELARKIFNHLKNKEILVLGAGKTAELAAYHFMENEVEQIHVVNRTLENAQALASKFRGKAYELADLDQALKKADIVITAASSQHFLINKDLIRAVAKERHYQPIFLIDLAIPRNIDPQIQEIDGVFLYNLDDLQEIVEMNLDKRKKEIPKSIKIVEDYVLEFQKWSAKFSMASVAGKLKKQLNQLRINEINRIKKDFPDEFKSDIHLLTENIINKIVRQHVKSLKRNAHDPERYQQQLELIYQLFDSENE